MAKDITSEFNKMRHTLHILRTNLVDFNTFVIYTGHTLNLGRHLYGIIVSQDVKDLFWASSTASKTIYQKDDFRFPVTQHSFSLPGVWYNVESAAMKLK